MKISVYVIGSNPLPCVIAMSYDFALVNSIPSDHIKPDYCVLISSNETLDYAERIKYWLSSKKLPDVSEPDVLLIDNAYNSAEIYQKTSEYIKKLPDIDNVFINASGGTKEMSGNILLALIDFASNNNIIIQEVDIDPERKKIYIYNPITHKLQSTWPDGAIADCYHDVITIDNIITLYRYIRKNETRDYLLENVINTISYAELLINNIDAYIKFNILYFIVKNAHICQEKFGKKFKDKQNTIFIESLYSCLFNGANTSTNEDINLLMSNGISLFTSTEKNKKFNENNPIHINIMSSLLSYYISLVGDSANKFIEALCKNGYLKQINNGQWRITENQLELLNGFWLEEYISAAIEQLFDQSYKDCIVCDQSSYEIVRNFEIVPDLTPPSTKNFEIDVVVRYGYTIFFISCTTDIAEGLNNKKVLEVLANAESLGLRTHVILATLAEMKTERWEKMFAPVHYNKLDIIDKKTICDLEELKKKLKCILCD